MYKQILILSIILLIAACENEVSTNQNVVSASACAKRLPNGDVIDCDVTSQSQESLDNTLLKMMGLDKALPGPKGPNIFAPDKSKLFNVLDISDEYVIHLENDEKIIFAGLKCKPNDDLHKYLNVVFLESKDNKVFYLPSGHEIDGAKYSYIWEVSIDANGYGSSSPLNETAITSKWCEPIKQERHLYHERYLSLSDI